MKALGRSAATEAGRDGAAQRQASMSIRMTVLLALVYMAAQATGDLLLSYGMRSTPISIPWVVTGVASFAGGYAVFLGMLKDVPLSVVVPTQAGNHLFIVALSWLVLGEYVPPQRWFGTLLVSVGVTMVILSDWQTRKAPAPSPALAEPLEAERVAIADPVPLPVPGSRQ